MNQLEAGPELDAAAAKAIGWQYEGFARRGPVYRDAAGVLHEIGVDWKPSTDWNASVEAVAAVHAFIAWRVHRRADGKFEFEALCRGDDGWSRFFESETGPLAICLAILAMTGTNYLST